MGYSTYYKLSTHNLPDTVDLAEELGDFISGCVEVNGKGDCEGIKWYEYEQDLKALAKKYPEVLFVLEGEGEEQGDVWICFFKGDSFECQRPEFKWPKHPKWAK